MLPTTSSEPSIWIGSVIRVADRLSHSLDRVVLGQAPGDDDELVTAETIDDVTGATRRLETGAEHERRDGAEVVGDAYGDEGDGDADDRSGQSGVIVVAGAVRPRATSRFPRIHKSARFTCRCLRRHEDPGSGLAHTGSTGLERPGRSTRMEIDLSSSQTRRRRGQPPSKGRSP